MLTVPPRPASFVAALCALACGRADQPAPPSTPARPAAEAPPGVALVELFTSEGCSSCPPADAVLGELAREAARDGRRVVPLAFHVDYWDRLGWRDPFASPANSERQRAYARAAGEPQVYTPQMIVNGRAAFVGSRRAEAERHVTAALARPAPISVTLGAEASERGALAVRYAAEGAPEDAVLHLALVQRATSQAVGRGENRGRTLRHTNVVRALHTIPAGSGMASLALPEGLSPADVFVAGWVQQGEVGPVLGAAVAEAGG